LVGFNFLVWRLLRSFLPLNSGQRDAAAGCVLWGLAQVVKQEHWLVTVFLGMR
jgi:hypothetical protein